jgi:hypothetical protein
MRVRRSLVVTAAALCAPLGLAACGEDDFQNENRPPSPVAVGALINDEQVVVSPSDIGAGIVSVTISNQSDDPATLTLAGPTEIASDQIQPGNTSEIKGQLKQGDYVVSAGDQSTARDDKLTVGPERPSSQNDLLLP